MIDINGVVSTLRRAALILLPGGPPPPLPLPTVFA
jgi:hypothetical protein